MNTELVRSRRYSILLLCMVLLILAGCGNGRNLPHTQVLTEAAPLPSAAAGPPLIFGIIYPMVNSTYETITENAEAAAGDHIKLLVQAPDEANLEQQIRIMEMMIKQEVDGIAIDPVDSAALVPVINQAVAKGIPVICFESDSPDSQRLAYIGADNVETGRVIGRTIDQLLGGKGMVLVESGMPHMLGLGQRLLGLQQYLETYTGIDVLEIQHNDGNEESAVHQLEQMISSHPHFSALISLDYVSSSGSILVWKAKGLKRYNLALGVTPSLKQSLENGQITRIISQNEQNWGETMIHTLESIAAGARVQEFINMDVAVIGE